MACHSIKPGVHMTGPSLARIWNRMAGTAEGFLRYSDAVKRSGVVWNDGTLDKWLADPEQYISGNSMTFPGLRESKDREEVVAYLKAVSEGNAPAAEPRRGGMMMRTDKANLKKAPPAGQVISINHCGDTYTVKTADGKVNKVWEFNLRFKTDSSKDGPTAGQARDRRRRNAGRSGLGHLRVTRRDQRFHQAVVSVTPETLASLWSQSRRHCADMGCCPKDSTLYERDLTP